MVGLNMAPLQNSPCMGDTIWEKPPLQWLKSSRMPKLVTGASAQITVSYLKNSSLNKMDMLGMMSDVLQSC